MIGLLIIGGIAIASFNVHYKLKKYQQKLEEQATTLHREQVELTMLWNKFERGSLLFKPSEIVSEEKIIAHEGSFGVYTMHIKDVSGYLTIVVQHEDRGVVFENKIKRKRGRTEWMTFPSSSQHWFEHVYCQTRIATLLEKMENKLLWNEELKEKIHAQSVLQQLFESLPPEETNLQGVVKRWGITYEEFYKHRENLTTDEQKKYLKDIPSDIASLIKDFGELSISNQYKERGALIHYIQNSQKVYEKRMNEQKRVFLQIEE